MTENRVRPAAWVVWLRAIVTAFETLRAYPLRTLLSTLGVVIGVASLVAILALGDGLEQYGRSQIAGTTDLQTIIVRPRTEVVKDGVRVLREHVASIAPADAASLGAALGSRADVAATIVGSAWARVPGVEGKRAVLVAATTPAVTRPAKTLIAGRGIWTEDMRSEASVVVVPESVAAWYDARPRDLLGRTLQVDGVDRRIIGVMKASSRPPVRLLIPLTPSVQAQFERPDRKSRSPCA